MAKQNETRVLSGIAAGVAGGLFASWVMNVFMERVNGQRGEERNQAAHGQEPKEDATMKTADAIVSTVTGGRHLSFEQRQEGGPIVHYAFGAIMGGVYGALAEYSPAATAGFGTAFAGALFAGADLIAVPALKLSDSAAEAPASTLVTPFAAHLVYGVATEGVRKLVRAVIVSAARDGRD
jgi:uncharacterized membrane protein YagU involved in acid resistance